MTSTDIQAIAAVIQAVAALAFLCGVVIDLSQRKRRREQERRDTIIRALSQQYISTHGATPEEFAGFSSQRQIDFFDTRLKEMGETWTFADRDRVPPWWRHWFR